MATYEFSGEKYKKASRHQKEWGESLISKLKLGGDERILDLGCGDGALTEHLASLVPRGCVIGIDASEGMIETAKKLAEIKEISLEKLIFQTKKNALSVFGIQKISKN